MKIWHVLILGILIGMAAAAVIIIVAAQPQGKPVQLVPFSTPSEILIYISGAVYHPGVYRLSPASRVESAVSAAGGMTPDADAIRVNLAKQLIDGDQIIIPKIGETLVPMTADDTVSPDQQIDLNKATVEELDSIPGIGMVKAQSIITYRESHGLFTSLDELVNVPGIGPALLEQIIPYLSILP
ncbi:MAG: helix-hairpin-helix domain-containing protein [Anaerolineaceae bacterium]|nr:helix-hairpin-helix domain-containing protein [Anaerolineaceae bacterium]MBN2677048.1 helix-hairpin-helix domain-containing protein [Anaerolineaceae bacterium]